VSGYHNVNYIGCILHAICGDSLVNLITGGLIVTVNMIICIVCQ
jgi:hypothetical protein